MIKYLITKYKKINRYGDGILEKDSIIHPFIGQAIMVKILWLWWIEYRSYYVIPNFTEDN